jgi:predicted MFS family arabinose efflux permease
MNSLSWFIYLTQVVDHMGGAAFGVLLVGGIGGFLGIILGPMALDLLDDPPSSGTIRTVVRSYIITMALAVVVVVFMPSRQTMLLIAGSEMGERLVKSEGVNSIVNPGVDLLKTWIKRETEKLTKGASK